MSVHRLGLEMIGLVNASQAVAAWAEVCEHGHKKPNELTDQITT